MNKHMSHIYKPICPYVLYTCNSIHVKHLNYWSNLSYFPNLLGTNIKCFCFFSVRLLSVLRGHSVLSSPPQRPITSDFEGFLSQILSITFFVIFILQKEPEFPFSMFSAKQGNYWYHCITSLVWRGPWMGIEPGTSRTRSQHSSTRLSRRRFI